MGYPQLSSFNRQPRDRGKTFSLGESRTGEVQRLKGDGQGANLDFA